MSVRHIERILKVQTEFYTALFSLTFVSHNWQKHNIFDEKALFDGKQIEVRPRDLEPALSNLEATYIVRLWAEFEGILKDHLAQTLPKDVKVDWLISQTLKRDQLTIDKHLRQRLMVVRDYRNSVAHHSLIAANGSFILSLNAVISALNTFLAKLPD